MYTCAGTHTHTHTHTHCGTVHVALSNTQYRSRGRHLAMSLYKPKSYFHWTADSQGCELIDSAFHLSNFLQSCVGYVGLFKIGRLLGGRKKEA